MTFWTPPPPPPPSVFGSGPHPVTPRIKVKHTTIKTLVVRLSLSITASLM
jgi:hypothetical protein